MAPACPMGLYTFSMGLLNLTDPADYLGLDAVLILAAGEREVCTNITIVPDDLYEPGGNEVFAVCLESNDPSVVVVLGKSLVEVIDNTGDHYSLRKIGDRPYIVRLMWDPALEQRPAIALSPVSCILLCNKFKASLWPFFSF